MHYLKTLTLTALLFGSALAAPNVKPTKPAKPTPTPGPVQTNVCGNNDAPYCCNTDGFGFYTTCYVLTGGNVCSATTVCCNADNSVQVCLGNAVIN
ncbi:hypothetical protein MMC30_002764 [Trapelia coarctata]|nr:hypothetical protein [Trapelia coarctata]